MGSRLALAAERMRREPHDDHLGRGIDVDSLAVNATRGERAVLGCARPTTCSGSSTQAASCNPHPQRARDRHRCGCRRRRRAARSADRSIDPASRIISPKRARSRSVRFRPPPANSAPVGSTVKNASCSAPRRPKMRSLQQVTQRLAAHTPQDGAERVGVHRLVGELLTMRDRLRDRLEVVEERLRAAVVRPDARGNRRPEHSIPARATSDRCSPRCSRDLWSCPSSWRIVASPMPRRCSSGR